MHKQVLIQKTYDVSCSPDILTALGMDDLFSTRSYDLLEYLTCDTELLTKRCLVFRDTIRIPDLLDLLKDTIDRLSSIREMLRLKSRISESDRGLYSVKQLEQYFAVIDAMAAFCSGYGDKLESEDFRVLFGEVAEIAGSSEYLKLKTNTKTVIHSVQNVRSITVGFNIDAALMPYEAGVLSINEGYIQSGNVIDRILRMESLQSDENHTLAPLVPSRSACTADEFEALTYSTYAALGKILKKQVRRIEADVDTYIAEHLHYLIELLPDLQFVYDLSLIQRQFIQAGLTVSVPVFRPKEDKCFEAAALYNPILAMHLYHTDVRRHVVDSDITFDADGGIYLLTGPNSGGKTVFLKSVGIAQIMAQIGMMVPARSMKISPVSHLYVEFPRVTTDRKAGGRLEYECDAIQKIFAHIDTYSLVLLDESFSSTAPDEAVALALEVLKAMSMMGVRGIYISHYHLLTERLMELNQQKVGQLRFDFLAAEIAGDSDRTYRIERRISDGKSYASSIASRYGISADELVRSRHEANRAFDKQN